VPTDQPLDEEERLQRLASWLLTPLDAADVTVAAAGKPSSGFSAQTSIIEATWTDATGSQQVEKLVLREETPDRAVYPVQDASIPIEIEVQVRVLSALGGCGLPVARILGYESDPALLGAPFFVMEFVSGDVPIESPMYTTQGFFTEATPEQRRRLIENGLAVLARLHDVDWQAAGLDWLAGKEAPTDGSRRQLQLWTDYLTAELAGRDHPLVTRALAWLPDRLPPDESVGFCWGDARPGNIIWQDFQVGTVTDFEASCLASPAFDVGWWLMFDRWAHEGSGVERLPGEPTRQEQLDLYNQFSGRDIRDTLPHEMFAALRYTAVVVGVMNRLAGRGLMPPESTVWRDNPASEVLAMLLEEVGA
jgi:aminoglycoside phosphotransferase (APT) family kinase protein